MSASGDSTSGSPIIPPDDNEGTSSSHNDLDAESVHHIIRTRILSMTSGRPRRPNSPNLPRTSVTLDVGGRVRPFLPGSYDSDESGWSSDEFNSPVLFRRHTEVLVKAAKLPLAPQKVHDKMESLVYG